ncbi:MAG TPA: hypothetical protein PKW90_01865, partial [Myxococcota bacterium]|nr:hypothetical protein [Myxococcota bacterium]
AAAAECVAPAGYTSPFLFDAGTLPIAWRAPTIPALWMASRWVASAPPRAGGSPFDTGILNEGQHCILLGSILSGTSAAPPPA